MQVVEKITHPYMDTLQETLAIHKKLLSHLELRLKLTPDFRCEYDKNEHEILKIKTIAEINAVRRDIAVKEEYFAKYMKQFEIDMEECNKYFDTVMNKAKKSSIKDVLEKYNQINWQNVNSNMQIKLEVYKKMKGLVY